VSAEVDEGPAAEVFDDGNTRRAPDLRELPKRRLGHETAQLEIAAMDLQQQPGALADGSLVVARMSAVGGADLDEIHPRALDDVRNPKRAANFDQLAPRDDDFPIPREGVERQQDGRSIVVDRERGRSFGEEREFRTHPREPVAAPAGFEIELEVRVTRGGSLDRLDGTGRQGRSAQIGVERDSRGVDDSGRLAAAQGCSQLSGPVDQILRQRVAFSGFRRGFRQALPRLREGAPNSLEDRPGRQIGTLRGHRVGQPIDSWQCPAGIRLDLGAPIHDSPS